MKLQGLSEERLTLLRPFGQQLWRFSLKPRNSASQLVESSWEISEICIWEPGIRKCSIESIVRYIHIGYRGVLIELWNVAHKHIPWLQTGTFRLYFRLYKGAYAQVYFCSKLEAAETCLADVIHSAYMIQIHWHCLNCWSKTYDIELIYEFPWSWSSLCVTDFSWFSFVANASQNKYDSACPDCRKFWDLTITWLRWFFSTSVIESCKTLSSVPLYY